MDTNFTDNFLVKENQKFNLKDFNTDYKGELTKEEGQKMLDAEKKKLYELQEKLYADGSQSLLVVIQAMDAAGKDSLIEHVFGGVNPQGFFNRSHYESVLVCKVHPEYNLSEKVWKSTDEINGKFWKNRYESIKDFEKHVARNGTKIVKIFLHVSKEEQKKRFLDRIAEQEKNWKFSIGDLKERAVFDQYMKAYEEAISETSKEHAPWFVIPADQKWFARVAAIQIIIETLEKMNLQYPTLSEEERAGLDDAKKQLESE